VTATTLARTSLVEREPRALIRWQHLLNQEHPTGTERKSLTQECGWKGGDRGGLAERKKRRSRQQKKLLLEGPAFSWKELWERAMGIEPKANITKVLTRLGITAALGPKRSRMQITKRKSSD